MAINLDDLMTALGRVGRMAYLINSGQNGQGTPFTQLSGYSYLNAAWLAPLATGYDQLIRNQSQSMNDWSLLGRVILQNMVAAADPAYGTSFETALTYVLNQFTLQGKTVKECTITSAAAADSANVGTGVCFVTTKRGDGLVLQNTVAEASVLLVTSDSYTGGATAGREPWVWQGEPNISSLGTGTGVGLWDWDFPQGSGASASGNVISADQDASSSGNMLTNGDFETWTAGSASPPDNWAVSSGVWDTDFRRGATALRGSYSVEFLAGTGGTPGLTQQFDSTDTTGATAGTAADITAYTGFAVNLWLRAAGVITGGVLTVELVDGSGVVINDQAGTANTETIALTGFSTSWTAKNFGFRLPIILPTTVRLRIRISTALTGANLFMDDVTFCQPTNLYPGGPNACVFAGATAFEASPDPDAFTLTFTNDRGGATYGATFQFLFNRLFQTPGLVLPYAAVPSYADTLITNA